MSFDRTIVFNETPSIDDVRAACVRYLGAAGAVHDEGAECFTLVLAGSSQGPFDPELYGDQLDAVLARGVVYPHERFVEVWRSERSVAITTRRADEYTSAVAEGIAAFVARRWDGKREQ